LYFRVHAGIDIDAGCGQLKADLLRKQKKSSAAAVGSEEAGASEACGAEVTPANNSVGGDGNSDDDSEYEPLVIPKMTADVEVEREHTFREMETEITGNRVQRKSPGPEQQQTSRKAPLKGSTSSSRGTNGASSVSGTTKKSTEGTENKPKKISLIRKPRPAETSRDASASGSPPAGKSSRSRRPE
jgi:hypothetical protein